MACSACQKRGNGGGRVVPVNPATKKTEKQPSAAVQKGNTLRSNLRYTGR